ncbi:MAG: ribonuclease HII [Pseudomonadota bacterium]
MPKTAPDFELETLARANGARAVCGVDEAGRGPWAGPIVAAAVILTPEEFPRGLNDSKQLSAKKRDAFYDRLMACAAVGIGMADVTEITRFNIGQAGFLAMHRAIANLPKGADFALVDGRHVPPGLVCDARAVIRGDGRSLSIAAASIVAKVTRDRIMVALAQQFPGYGWETNMGYGTKAHATGLQMHGVTPHHRRTFRPIHEMLCHQAETDFHQHT